MNGPPLLIFTITLATIAAGSSVWATPLAQDLRAPAGPIGPPAKVTKGAGATPSEAQRSAMGAASPEAGIGTIPRSSAINMGPIERRGAASRTMHMPGVSGMNDMGANASVGPRRGANTGSGPGADVAPEGPGGPH